MSEPMDSKKCILAVAAKLFAKLGLDKTSTREIAKESNSNISLISYYFGGKEGLYKEVLRNFAIEMKDTVHEKITKAKKGPMTKKAFKDEIYLIVDIMIYFRTKYPEVSQIFSREKLTGLQHSKQIHEEIFYPMAKEFIRIFESAQEAGIVKKDIHPILFFTVLTEGIAGFFSMKDCPTAFAKECTTIHEDIEKLKKQITEIYTQGVLL